MAVTEPILCPASTINFDCAAELDNDNHDSTTWNTTESTANTD